MVLASVHPGVTEEEVQAETGWRLQSAAPVVETPPPSADELAMIRRFDPEGFWTGARR
jgi:glutaconate CoA-transferase subunit B